MILEAAGATHQFIAKPCEALELRNIVDRSCALRLRLGDDGLREMLSQMQSVPVLPQLYNEMMRELQSGEPSIEKVGEIIASDIGMTARILQLVNSSYFGLSRHVSSPTEAVMLLGLATLRALVIQTKIFSSFENLGASGLTAASLSSEGLRIASLARKLASEEGLPRKEQDYAFIAGMMQNLGKLVLAANYAARYRAVVDRMRAHGVPDVDVELEEFGSTHMDVSAYLLELWGFAHPVVEAVAFYRRPGLCEANDCSPLTVVHVASALLAANGGDALLQHLDAEYIERIGLTGRIPAWQAVFNDWNTNEEANT
jgi:HD-like signal output (HDOD) protein